jgi:hypothetical protein
MASLPTWLETVERTFSLTGRAGGLMPQDTGSNPVMILKKQMSERYTSIIQKICEFESH